VGAEIGPLGLTVADSRMSQIFACLDYKAITIAFVGQS